jgi:hypothetical protein
MTNEKIELVSQPAPLFHGPVHSKKLIGFDPSGQPQKSKKDKFKSLKKPKYFTPKLHEPKCRILQFISISKDLKMGVEEWRGDV